LAVFFLPAALVVSLFALFLRFFVVERYSAGYAQAENFFLSLFSFPFPFFIFLFFNFFWVMFFCPLNPLKKEKSCPFHSAVNYGVGCGGESKSDQLFALSRTAWIVLLRGKTG
jgi:hypothetical protein